MDVYISNLRHNITESDLRARLEYIGMVTGVEIHRNPERHTFAVVSMLPADKLGNHVFPTRSAAAVIK